MAQVLKNWHFYWSFTFLFRNQEMQVSCFQEWWKMRWWKQYTWMWLGWWWLLRMQHSKRRLLWMRLQRSRNAKICWHRFIIFTSHLLKKDKGYCLKILWFLKLYYRIMIGTFYLIRVGSLLPMNILVAKFDKWAHIWCQHITKSDHIILFFFCKTHSLGYP